MTMRRRDFITLLGSAAAAWPLAARAQQSLPVVGVLGTGSGLAGNLAALLRQGLRESGHEQGRNFDFEFRYAENQYDRLPALAADLVRRQVAVIIAPGLPAAVAAKAATSSIPIVFFSGADPVRAGLVTSLSRPTGNLTGVTNLDSTLFLKRLELIRELLPATETIGVLVNPNNPNVEMRVGDIEEAARSIGQKISVLNASRSEDLPVAYAAADQQRVAAIVVSDDSFIGSHSELLAMLEVAHRIPTISNLKEFVMAGGLISYSAALDYRQMGDYVGRILKGQKPTDLPVVQSTKFELTINLKAAKALQLNVPPLMLARADEVIE
jgi:putative ABC transport system substrate-binding protein